MSEDSSKCYENSIIDYSDKHIKIDQFNDKIEKMKKVAEKLDYPQQQSVFSKIQEITQMNFLANKKKLNLNDSRNQTYDSFTNNSLENFKDSMKIEDCLELLIKNQENNS